MNVFTANASEAAGRLARHDDGAPPTATPPLASDGQGCHAIWLVGTGQVTASQAEMIEAAPGRARRRLGMRHTSLRGRAGRAEPVIAVMAGWGRACRAE
jgi:hypothetical protein